MRKYSFKTRIFSGAVLQLLMIIAACLPQASAAQQTVIIVRHGEKVEKLESGDIGKDAKDVKDPPLSVVGMARAEKLAQMLSATKINAIYVTQYRRTAMHATPLATRQGITPVVVPAADTAGLIKRLASHGADETVLVVGHSNTVPLVLKGLGAVEEVKLTEDEYDNLFMLVPKPGAAPTVTRLKY